MAGLTKKALMDLKDPANRSHPSLRWGQAIVNDLLRNSNYSGYKTPDDLFYADGEKTMLIIQRMVEDYQL